MFFLMKWLIIWEDVSSAGLSTLQGKHTAYNHFPFIHLVQRSTTQQVDALNLKEEKKSCGFVNWKQIEY